MHFGERSDQRTLEVERRIRGTKQRAARCRVTLTKRGGARRSHIKLQVEAVAIAKCPGDKGFENETQLFSGLSALLKGKFDASEAQTWKHENGAQRYAQPTVSDLEANGWVPNLQSLNYFFSNLPRSSNKVTPVVVAQGRLAGDPSLMSHRG